MCGLVSYFRARSSDENADLRERPACCWQHVEHLRARLAEVGRPMRTAEPVDRPSLRVQATTIFYPARHVGRL